MTMRERLTAAQIPSALQLIENFDAARGKLASANGEDVEDHKRRNEAAPFDEARSAGEAGT